MSKQQKQPVKKQEERQPNRKSQGPWKKLRNSFNDLWNWQDLTSSTITGHVIINDGDKTK